MKERPAAPSLSNLLASSDLSAVEMPLIPRHAVWYLPGYRDASVPPAERRLNELKKRKCLLSSCLSYLFLFKENVVSAGTPPWLALSRSSTFLSFHLSRVVLAECFDLGSDGGDQSLRSSLSPTQTPN